MPAVKVGGRIEIGGPTVRRGGNWIAIAAAIAFAGRVADAIGVPSAYLFVALAVGIVYALATPRAPVLPGWAAIGAQAVIGVIIGEYVKRSTLTTVASNWLPVVLVCVASLALSLVGGLALARFGRVDAATASFGMIAGGAVGIIAMSRDLGADERIVAVLQYLRVLIIAACTPVIAAMVFGLPQGHAPASHGNGTVPANLLFVGLCGAVGVGLGSLGRVPGFGILGPMIVAAGATVVLGPHVVPSTVGRVAFAVIGLEIGLRFTIASLRQAGAVPPGAIIVTLALIVLCLLMGVGLAHVVGLRSVDGYFATTPGGLSVVLALSIATHGNIAFVLALQVLRTVVMLLAAPPFARRLARVGTRPAARLQPTGRTS